MEYDLPPVINIDASLVNVQRGDVMIIRMPENVHFNDRTKIANIIRDMLITQDIDIPILTIPYKWDVMMVEKEDVHTFEDIDQDDETEEEEEEYDEET